MSRTSSTATESKIIGGPSWFPPSERAGGERGSSGLPAKGQIRRTQSDPVPIVELCAFDPLAVDLHPVRGPEVDDPVRRTLLTELSVAPRDVGVGELDVALT